MSNINLSKMVTKADKDAKALTELKAAIAARRFTAETAGVTVQGMKVFSDRTTQMKLTAASLRAQRDPEYSVDWKCENGAFVTLDADQIVAVADAVGDYVQACYSREGALLTAVDNGSYTTGMIEQGWPSNE